MNTIPHASSLSNTSNNGGSPHFVDATGAALAIHRLNQATEASREQSQPDPVFQVRLPLEPGGIVNVTS